MAQNSQSVNRSVHSPSRRAASPRREEVMTVLAREETERRQVAENAKESPEVTLFLLALLAPWR